MPRWKKCPMCEGDFFGLGKHCSETCSLRAVSNAINQLKKKEGPIYDKWKKNLKASLKRL